MVEDDVITGSIHFYNTLWLCAKAPCMYLVAGLRRSWAFRWSSFLFKLLSFFSDLHKSKVCSSQSFLQKDFNQKAKKPRHLCIWLLVWCGFTSLHSYWTRFYYDRYLEEFLIPLKISSRTIRSRKGWILESVHDLNFQSSNYSDHIN